MGYYYSYGVHPCVNIMTIICYILYHTVCRQLVSRIHPRVLQIIVCKVSPSREIMSDMGATFVSDNCKYFFSTLNMEQVTSSSYYHQINEQIITCIRFIKCTIKEYVETNSIINLSLIQSILLPLGLEWPHQDTVLVRSSIRGLMPTVLVNPRWLWSLWR